MLTWATGDGWCHGTVNPKHQSVTVHYILTCTKGFAFHFHFPLSKDAHVWHASCVLSLLDFRLELESPHIHAILGQHSASNSTTSMWSSAPPAFSPWLQDIFPHFSVATAKTAARLNRKHSWSPTAAFFAFRVQQTTLQPNTFQSVSSLSLPWVRGWEHQKTLKNPNCWSTQHTHLASSCLGFPPRWFVGI